MNIFRFSLCTFLSCVLFIASASAHPTKLAATDQTALVQGASHLEMLHAIKNLPAPVTNACEGITSDHKCDIADPTEEFQATDVITKEGLPKRRLLWVAHIPGYYILHYEKSGYAHSQHVVVIAYDDVPAHEAKVVWKAASDHPLPDYKAFLAALSSDTLDDSRDYYY